MILFNANRPVKTNASFGLGIFASAAPMASDDESRHGRIDAEPTRSPRRKSSSCPTPEDAQWWAENSPANAFGYEVVGYSDAMADRLAGESEALDFAEKGLAIG